MSATFTHSSKVQTSHNISTLYLEIQHFWSNCSTSMASRPRRYTTEEVLQRLQEIDSNEFIIQSEESDESIDDEPATQRKATWRQRPTTALVNLAAMNLLWHLYDMTWRQRPMITQVAMNQLRQYH